MKAALLTFALALAAGCGEGSRACRVAADCASGVCQSNGMCAPLASTSGSSGSSASSSTTTTSSTTTSSTTSGTSSTSSTTSSTSSTGSTTSSTTSGSSSSSSSSSSTTTGTPSCLPDGDGVVQRSELTLQAGLHGIFRIAEDAGFDTAGTPLGDGGTAWDLTQSFAGDTDTLVTTNSLDGGWFAADFPDATYTTQLTASSDLLGVFQETQDAVMLLGVVSPSQGNTQTELTYDPPVTVLQFPISMNASWSTNASLVSGTFQGLSSAYYETYESTVDAQGAVLTPFATFPVLRVNTLLTRNVGGVVSYTRTHAFVTDCFGTVAQVSSDVAYGVPPADDFTSASELRRLAP